MNEAKRGSLPRCLLTWMAATAVAVALVVWAAPDLSTIQLEPFDAWLTWLCTLAVVLCAAWGWLVISVVVLEALSHRPRRAAPVGVPAWLRRVVLAACGVAVLGSAAPALAASVPFEPDRQERPSVLEGLPLPDRAEGRSVSQVVARAISEPPAQHLVVPGDSLWSIAEAALHESGASATAADVAAYWPRIYALNRDLVGADPDLLTPGQLLQLADLPGEDPR